MTTDFPYKKVFDLAEATLLDYGSKQRPRDEIRAALDSFKHYEGKQHSDDEFFQIMTAVAFYSGFRASTVTAHMPVIEQHFPGWRIVANYTTGEIERIQSDSRMIKNRRKIEGCVKNARFFSRIIDQHKSFQHYIESFKPTDSVDNLLRLKRDLQLRFAYLGGITAYHFLTDIGMPVLKPDRVITRLFFRLGVTADETDLSGTVEQGNRFAEATGLPIRYIDIVFVALGQAQSLEFGIDRGICLIQPRCNECKLTSFCLHHATERR